MGLTLATDYGTTEILAPLPMPKRGPTGPTLSADRARSGKQGTAALAGPQLCAAAGTASLRILIEGARQEARHDPLALAVLWAAGWMALLLACV